MKKAIKIWRKKGAFIIVVSMIVSCFFSCIAVGVLEILMLTVPCGLKKVNNNRWLWNLRQLYFLSVGLLTIFLGKGKSIL